jgi:3-phytase
VSVPRPNNIDVEHGVVLGGQRMDIAVCNARGNRTMHVFRIDSKNGTLTDISTPGGIRTPELEDPYGLSIYLRPRDGAVFVIASTEKGKKHTLHQYRLEDDGSGHVKGTYVRRLGDGSITTFVEGIVVDDALGWVYASDEDNAIRKYAADPDAKQSDPVVSFAQGDGIVGDREGLALYDCGGGKGWILLSSQGDGTVKIYRREGEPGKPNQHDLVATLVPKGSLETDGLDVTNLPAVGYPAGFLAKHDSEGRKFVLYSWSDVAKAGLPCGATPKP